MRHIEAQCEMKRTSTDKEGCFKCVQRTQCKSETSGVDWLTGWLANMLLPLKWHEQQQLLSMLCASAQHEFNSMRCHSINKHVIMTTPFG